jgi:hypothetical protein
MLQNKDFNLIGDSANQGTNAVANGPVAVATDRALGRWSSIQCGNCSS